MGRRLAVFCWLAAIGFASTARGAGPYGVDNGWAVDDSGNILLTSSVATELSQAEAGWVRVEMRLFGSHTNWDSTILGYYDTAVNNARAAGLQVLLLIDGGSWPGSQTNWCQNNSENNPGVNGDNPYVEGYATNAVVPIVQHFSGRVNYYELWNEPNCWTSNPSNGVYTGSTYIYPSNYGWLLTRSWEAVHIAQQITNVTLFSGGLFGLNSSGANYTSAGGQYLDDTYSTGTNVSKGGSFAHTKSNYNAYPLDGVGQHLYISQGGLVTSNLFREYEDWVRQAYTKYEGTNTPKKTFITEFAWETTNSVNTSGVSQAVQDTNLVTAFSAINATPYVQMAIWFSLEDNTAADLYYGVLDATGTPKQSYPDFQRAERFEGMYSSGATNAGIQTYYLGLGQAVLGDPYDNGQGAWVYAFLNGYAQDCNGGSHLQLTLMSSTNGAFELNNLHGFWSFYSTNNGSVAYGYVTTNAYAYGSGTRQDFLRGYLTWDATNQVVWHAGNLVPAPPAGLQTTALNEEVDLQWNAVSNATSYNVKRSTANGGPYSTLTSVVGSPVYADGSVANNTTYYYVVSAVNSYGESSNSAPANATPNAGLGNLPSPWQDADIGNVGLTGAAGYSSGRFTIEGAGANIGSTNDAFNFTSQPWSGNGAIIARLKTQQNTSPWAQAGVMFRETLASNSTYALVLLTPTNGSQFQARTVTGGGTAEVAGPDVAATYWLELVRNGNTFTASVSSNGVNYVEVGATNFTMATNAWVGFAVCSDTNSALSTATFDNVTVTAPPTITTPPQSQTAQLSSNVTFTVSAASASTAGYQWYFGTNTIAGATGTTLGLTNVGFAQAGSYSVVVTNAAGSATGGPVVLTVIDTIPPTITACASNRTLAAGATCQAVLPDLTGQVIASDASGAVTVTQNPPPGTALGLGITNVTFTARDSSGNTSYCAATVTVADLAPPLVAFCATNVTLTASTNCQGILPDLTSTNYILAFDNCSSVTVTQMPPAGTVLLPGTTNQVTLTAFDSAGNATNCAVAVVVPGAPSITLQPTNVSAALSSNVTFSVAACGAGQLFYQWQHADANLANATNAVLILPGIQTNDAGSYAAVITNSAGSVTSLVATLTILQPPVITGQPASLASVLGGSVTFSVSVGGWPPFAYQWQTNTVAVAGATNATLTIAPVQARDFAPYTVLVSNAGGAVLSQVANLTLAVAPAINSLGFASGTRTFTFPTELGPAYVVQYKYSLNDPSWQVLTNVPGTGGPITITDNDQTNPVKFYRLQVQ
jgi:regulation of enolase protein 1 (concanavalin A-like superfamily)